MDRGSLPQARAGVKPGGAVAVRVRPSPPFLARVAPSARRWVGEQVEAAARGRGRISPPEAIQALRRRALVMADLAAVRRDRRDEDKWQHLASALGGYRVEAVEAVAQTREGVGA